MSSIAGLPAHILFVHVVVVLLPASAVVAVVVALNPRFRARYGVAAVIGTFLVSLAVPIAAQTGEGLASRLPTDSLIRAHAALGQQLVPWTAVFGLCLAALVAIDLWRRGVADPEPRLRPLESWLLAHAPRAVRSLRPGGWLRPAFRTAQVLAVATALAVGVWVVRVGDSGARAVWSHYPGLSSSPAPPAASP